ncbi:MAG: adenylate kinase [Candidatus Dependentiae bacterium]|nr:adenylate kinase [Candidatus Dependentiae bacterium]
MAHQGLKREVIAFFGPPGSGKGTVAQIWQQRGGVISLSTGSLCRQHIQEQTVHGKEFKQLLDKGLLIPDALMSAMVGDWLIAHKDHEGVILLDGYPRTAEQVRQWHEIMVRDMVEFAHRVVLFEISDNVLVDRLCQRLTCSNSRCQKVYSLTESLSTCLDCGSALVRRHDDEPEVIAQRLNVYAGHKRALLAACETQGVEVKIFNVDEVPFKNMFECFLKVLSEKGCVAK